MSDDNGELEVSQQELGFEDQVPNNQEEGEEEQGDSPRGSRSPSPPTAEDNGEQQGGEDPDPDDPSKGSDSSGDGSKDTSKDATESHLSGSVAGAAGGGVTNPVIRGRFESQDATIKALQAQVAVLVANAQAGMPAPAQKSAFQGVKLRPRDPPMFTGEDKRYPVKDWLATVTEWLASGSCEPQKQVGIAQTFLDKGAATYWRARSSALRSQGADTSDFALFAKTLESGFGHQDPEQNARDKLERLTQTGSVEDYSSRFQSLSAEIVTLPLSEGDKIQRFRNGLKAELQTAAGIDPLTGKRWVDLGKFIDYACSVDANRVQAGKQKGGADSGASGGSGKSSVSYKDKLQNNKRAADSQGGPPAKKGKSGHGKGKFNAKPKEQDAKQKANDWENRNCFKCHQPGHQAKDCNGLPQPPKGKKPF